MKYLRIIVVTLILFACGDSPETLETKKATLKSLKEQASDLKTQISSLRIRSVHIQLSWAHSTFFCNFPGEPTVLNSSYGRLACACKFSLHIFLKDPRVCFKPDAWQRDLLDSIGMRPYNETSRGSWG